MLDYNKKATKDYKRRRARELNQLLATKRFTSETFSDCVTEIQVDNRKRKLLFNE